MNFVSRGTVRESKYTASEPNDVNELRNCENQPGDSLEIHTPASSCDVSAELPLNTTFLSSYCAGWAYNAAPVRKEKMRSKTKLFNFIGLIFY